MMTMYEKLMTLPIFKGLSPDHLSSFLEKTNLNFNTYKPGVEIMAEGDVCREVTCVLTGDLETEFRLLDGNVKFVALYGSGKILGLERLFGMNTSFPCSVRAVNNCGTMSFSKHQYLTFIRDNEICLINFMNYLSYRAQLLSEISVSSLAITPSSRIADTVRILSDRDCLEIRIYGIDDMVSKLDAQVSKMYEERIWDMREARVIETGRDGEIVITNRAKFLEYADQFINFVQ